MKISFLRGKPVSFFCTIIAVGIVTAIALFLRLELARKNIHPGHGDPAFYYTLAKSFANGQGLNINYVWHFLNGPVNIIHYGADFWLPMTGIVAGLSLLVFGKSMFAALLPFIAAGLIIAITTYFIAYDFSHSRFTAIGAGLLALFTPSLFQYSLSTDSVILFVLFAAPALYLIALGREKPRAFLFAASLIALAQWTRQDGIILLVVLAIFLLLSPLPSKQKVFYLAGSLFIWLLILSPMMARNYFEIGALFPSGSSKTMFLTTYEDFYAYGKTLDLQHYLAWGLEKIMNNKMAAAQANLQLLANDLGIFLLIGSALSVGNLIVKKEVRKFWLLSPTLLAILGFFAFYTLIASFSSFGGAFQKGLLVSFPLLISITLDFLKQITRSKVVVGTILVLALVTYGFQAYNQTNELLSGFNNLERRMLIVKKALEKDGQENGINVNDIVLMTRNPWEFNATTGMKAVQIPNNDLDTIYAVAKIYKANYLLMTSLRTTLEPLFEGKIKDERFIPIGYLKNTKLFLYRIQ